MDKTTERLAAYAASLSYSDLAPRAVHATKRCVIDALGCALGAFNAQPVKAVRTLASQVTAARPATILGTRIRSSAELAGFANGAMIRYSDFSDDYFGGNGMQPGPHPSDNIGSLLAITESSRGNGKILILGVALAYEGCDQLVDHIVLHPPGGWDYPIMHSLGTAIGAGRVLGLSREQMGHAVSLALVPNICLWQTRLGVLSNWKGLAGPNGSRNGLFAALLAKEGITGPAEPFEGKAGFMKQLGCPFKLGKLGGKGTGYRIEGTFFKYLPVMYSLQLPIWAALDLRARVDVTHIQSLTAYVDAHVYHTDAFALDRWDPKTRESADHSGPYLIAAALMHGEINDETMIRKRYRDSAILRLMKKIHVAEEKQYTAYPRVLECRLEATLKSGKTITVHAKNPKGHPANPLSDDEIEQKFLGQANRVLTSIQSRTLLDRLWDLQKVKDMREIFAPMVVQRRRTEN